MLHVFWLKFTFITYAVFFAAYLRFLLSLSQWASLERWRTAQRGIIQALERTLYFRESFWKWAWLLMHFRQRKYNLKSIRRLQVWKKERWKWCYHRQGKAQDYFRGKGRGSIFYKIKMHWKSFKERTASSRLTTGRKTVGLKYKSKLLKLSYLLNQVQKGDYTQKDKGPWGVTKVSKEWITWKPTEKILQELQKLELEGAGHRHQSFTQYEGK